jgi:hypothetical protein
MNQVWFAQTALIKCQLLTKENLNLKCDNLNYLKLLITVNLYQLAFIVYLLDQAKFNSFVKGNSAVSSGFEFFSIYFP